MKRNLKHSLEFDWFGQSIGEPIFFDLSLDQENLTFTTHHTLCTQPLSHSIPDTFTPGLWKADCVELFLAAPHGPYLELNLASNGAWWAAWFASPRQPAGILPPKAQPKHQIQETHSFSGVASLQIPLSELGFLGKLSQCDYNITAISGSPEQKFLSLVKLPGEQPDFHQPGHFRPLAED